MSAVSRDLAEYDFIHGSNRPHITKYAKYRVESNRVDLACGIANVRPFNLAKSVSVDRLHHHFDFQNFKLVGD